MGDLGRLVMRSGAPQLRLRLTAAVVLVLVGKLAAVISPVMLGEAINTLSVPGGVVVIGGGFVALALAFAGLRLLSACAPFARDAIFTAVSQATMARAAVEGFGHAVSLSLDFHQSKQTGTLARVIERGARSTDFLIRSVVFNLGPTAVELVLAMGVMVVRLDWRFAATAFLTVVIYAIVTFKITDWRLSHRRELNEADARAAGLSVDALINFETVKTFGAESRAVGAYGQALDTYVGAAVKANTSLSLLNGAQAVILNLGLAVMTVLAGVEVAAGTMRIGDVTMAILLLIGIYAPLNMLGFNYREIRQAFIDMEQLVALTGRTPDIIDAADAQALPPAAPQGARLEFRDVAFRHDARSQGLLDVSFVAEPGTTVALVGPSGAGKTTAVRLALRLIDPQGGAVLMDGVDLRQIRQSALRGAVALVPQDVALFNDTLRANIAFARPDASAAEIQAAAEAAELGAFIEGLPEGLDTMVGERGLKLSGGERQRVGIARALLANPRLLILDEATSALDGRTEEAIQATLRKVRTGRTTLVVAHRLSTIVDADLIVVLRRGRVVEHGTHDSLLEAAGEYAALWRRQTRQR
ncbi:MAG: ABC transporter ATP-binding protein/permease [Phenylobacterium sp.]|uniref:ABCB family ABC transporter ATP-binding protein/permease n=1 Tax=Phenylobacterium sp. TaxID=1871053 RepID=UPI002731EDE3|nr:ABC transporter ATP-binding protein/permease [Phenylobacterium sp.]MDP1618597.1 ABC transporter ATP-binding protein/permease [Phenylobacterium sp.]MDP1989162.1 ABC transporter ATP-binding protein/permease [Phenylobacterium sp.]MDP3382179.1 ABC transporter ATP-binding protein/permease [Phenylobacterium sp.]